MSAICGVFSPRRRELASREILAKMVETLRERGPAGDRSFVDDAAGVAIGHVYAPSFIGPSETPVPTFHEDERVVVALDGHVFNRDALVPAEHRGAYADQHTGAVVELFERTGEVFPSGLEGYFDLALWDRREQVLQVASDPLGSKPVYFYHDAGKQLFVFASELKAIFAHPSVTMELNEQGLANYLATSGFPPPFTAIKGASKLFPAEAVTFDREGRIERRCYWRFPGIDKLPGSFEQWTEKTQEQMRRSLTAMTSATPRLAVMNSGGLDSALLVAALQDAGQSEIASFTVAYGKDKTRGDFEWGERVAKEAGVRHFNVEIGPEEATPELLLKLMSAYDEPADTSRCITQHCISAAMAREGFDSCLTGGEGEAVFGGFKSWLNTREKRENGMTDDEFIEMFFRTGAFLKLGEQEKLMVAPVIDPKLVFDPVYEGLRERVPLDSLYDYFHTMVALRLSYSRASIFNHVTAARAGVETRPAYRDLGLMLFSRDCPNEHKGSEDEALRRGILIAAYGDLVPSVREERPKSGFPGLPWANPAYPKLEAVVLRVVERLKQSGLVQPRVVDKMIKKYRERGYGTSIVMKLWLLFELQVWLDLYVNHEDPFR